MAEVCPFEITPIVKLTPSAKSMSIYSLNYTSQDYWSFKDRMLGILRQNFDSQFNDLNESSLTMMLMELWAFLADTLSFKIDQIANEIFIDTVTEPENAFRLANFVGLRLTAPVPAKAQFIATIASPFSQDVEINAPYLVEVKDNDGFKTTYEVFAADVNGDPLYKEKIIIPAGKTFTKSLVGLHGRTVTDVFHSNGAANHSVKLNNSRIFNGSIRVYVGGVEWQQVDYFSETAPLEEYRVEYTSDYSAFIIFGDNRTGLIPPFKSKIVVSYRLGGESSGAIVTGAIDEPLYVSMPGLDHRPVVYLKNFTKGQGSYQGDSIEEIRHKLPKHLRAQNRGVSGRDYQTIVEQFSTAYHGMVGKSTVSLRNSGCAGNIIDVYVVARNGHNELIPASNDFKNKLSKNLEDKKMFTDNVCIRDGTVVPVDVHLDVFLEPQHRRMEALIREKVERRLEGFFDISNWTFGQHLREIDIVKVLADIQEIAHFDVSFTSAKGLQSGSVNDTVMARYDEIIVLDDFQIAFNYKLPGEN